ncbi:MAG: DUF1998 domain-containing protein [Kosmotogaceae bacterium]
MVKLDEFFHEIQEGSAFFQGHPDQFFTKNKMSYQVMWLNEDFTGDSNLNFEKYRRFFYDLIRKKLILRATKEGYDYHLMDPKDLKITCPRLLDSRNDDGTSGRFKVYPNSAICTNCHTYFNLNENKPCKCSSPIEHFTFVAFCDECGANYPIEAMSNLGNDCKKCGEKNGFKKLSWSRKDDLRSYKVVCKKCNSKESLILYMCDHKTRPSKKVRSNKPASNFRGVPARAGAIFHPFVRTIPDIPLPDEIDSRGMRNATSIELSRAFKDFFGGIGNINESYLHLPEFREAILSRTSFWRASRIEVICDDLEIEIQDVNQLKNYEIYKIIKTTLLDAKNRLVFKENGNSNKEDIFKKFHLDEIKDALESLEGIELDEEDMQALFLLSEEQMEQVSRGAFATKKRSIPQSMPPDWEDILANFKLQKITHIENLNMIQALLGIIDGSTRRDPQLFRVIETGKKGNKKPTVFIRNFKTEGILFKFSIEKIVEWLKQNDTLSEHEVTSTINIEVAFRESLSKNVKALEQVKILLHTFSHLLIQQSSVDTGLDIQSLSENILPKTAAILLYSTNEINIGGLEYTFDFHMIDWLSRVKELAEDCPQDPGCMEDESGACNACSFLPEFVCRYFNQSLDRSSLVGGTRHDKGFFK